MTCIVGLVQQNIVYIGGDSLASGSSDSTVIRTPKVFRTGDFLFGVCGSLRAIGLLRFAFHPPSRPFAMDLECYFMTEFLNALRQCFYDGGFTHESSNVESFYGGMLIGYRGRLFEMGGDFGVLEPLHGYSAIGSGGDFALGALYATQRTRSPVNRLMYALSAAEEHGQGVRRPFVVESEPAGVSARGA